MDFQEHDLLTLEECADVSQAVMAQRGAWQLRAKPGFYTLGAASYLDASLLRDIYASSLAQTNVVLAGAFPQLYQSLQGFFGQLLGERCYYHDGFALPGFHIFAFDGSEVEDVSGRAHFDLQFGPALEATLPQEVLSFTLPVAEPTGGSALDIWGLRHDEYVREGYSLRDWVEEHPPERQWSYTLGRMLVHDGLTLHAIGAPAVKAPTGERITLQGHAIKRPDGWLLYW